MITCKKCGRSLVATSSEPFACPHCDLKWYDKESMTPIDEQMKYFERYIKPDHNDYFLLDKIRLALEQTEKATMERCAKEFIYWLIKFGMYEQHVYKFNEMISKWKKGG